MTNVTFSLIYDFPFDPASVLWYYDRRNRNYNRKELTMNTLFDQIIIYLLCASFWFSKPVSFATVTLFLSVLLCGNLINLSNSSKFCFGLFGGFVALSFALPDLFYFYPFIIYEIEGKTTQKKYIFVLMSFRFLFGCTAFFCLDLRSNCRTLPKRKTTGNRNTVRHEMRITNILMI